MDAQELENLKKSSSTKFQDAGESTSEKLERNLNPNKANNDIF